MSQLTLSTLLHQIGSDKVTGFFLVLARVSPLFVLAPLFSSKMVPARVKGIVAVALSIGLTPLAVHGQRIPTDPMAVAGMLVVQVLVGLAFAFAVGMVLTAIEVAGPLLLVGLIIGLVVSVFQAVTQIQEQSLSFIPKIVGIAALIVILGPWMLGQLVTYAQNLYESIPQLIS